MSIIKFNDTENHINANLSFDESHHVKIEFISKNEIPSKSTLLNGFKELNEHNYLEQSDFSEMKYLYRQINDTVYILSKDPNDIYTEPPMPDTTYSDFIPDTYTPSIEEIKTMKILALSKICSNNIINGVDINIDGISEHFSYTEIDQANIKELFDLTFQNNLPMYYHSNGNGCKLYTVEQIAKIYTSASLNKMHHVTYFNQLKMYINSLDDKEIISSIEYGVKLTGKYLHTYNSAMEQFKASIKKFFQFE